jgi:cold shock protein
MRVGTVKWFNRRNGYGFILDEQVGDVFVHFSQIEETSDRRLIEGDVVEYEIVQGEKGPKAAKVVKRGPAPSADSAT